MHAARRPRSPTTQLRRGSQGWHRAVGGLSGRRGDANKQNQGVRGRRSVYAPASCNNALANPVVLGAPGRETVARTNPCLAAGVAAVSLLLLLGGSGAAVAFADPGGSRGSDRGSSADRGDGGRGGSKSGKGEDARGTDARGTDGPRNDGPRTRVGSGREDTARLSPGDADSGSGGGSGAESPGATSAFEPPKVTFGSGRAPGIQNVDPEPRWPAPARQPAEPPPPPPPAPPAPASSLVDRVATRPPVVRQFVVAPAAEITDPMWGIAGLLLIPAAGAALGYRQARAAQSAERLRRS